MFEHQKKLSPLHYPSVSSCKKVRAMNRVHDGKDPTTFKKHRAVLDHRGVKKEQALLMCDEIHLKQGVRWSTKQVKILALKITYQI